jgi:hypothetical protein
MPKSTRHYNIARREAASAVSDRKPYAITDVNHRPDLRGEFAGAKVKRQGDQQIVHLTPQQAKFYIDSGAIVPLDS